MYISQVSVYRTIGPLVSNHFAVTVQLILIEPRREKTGLLPMRKQRRRSASQ